MQSLKKIRLKKTMLHSIIRSRLETFELETETLKIVFASTSKANPEINMFIQDKSLTGKGINAKHTQTD